MAEQSQSSLYDDNGFEKVQHADISPSASIPPSSGAVQDLYGSTAGDIEAITGGMKPLVPSVSPTATSFQITSGVSGSSPSNVGEVSPSGPASFVTSSLPSSMGGAKADESKACCGCSWYKNVDPRVLDLIYWRDVKKTGAVFGSLLVLLLSLALFSVLSVIAYLSLIILTVTVTFRLYKNVLAAVQKTGEGHPFKHYLDMDISLPEEKLHEASEGFVKSLTRAVSELRRLFLVEDMVDSIKFGLLLWVLTYIGAWFNGMTLIIIGLVVVFTLPKVYDTYKVQIDQYVDLARTKIQAVVKQVQEKLPLPGKKKQA